MEDMSILTTNKLDLQTKQMNIDKIQNVEKTVSKIHFEQLTVASMVKTMLEIIQVKNVQDMDDLTKKQFQMIAKEVILLAEQTQ